MKASLFCSFLLFGTLLTSTLSLIAQTSVQPNTLYAELGGNGLFTSLNYERQLLRQTRLDLHIGAGIYGLRPAFLTIPLGVRYLVKLHKLNSFIDIGFGATYSRADVALYALVEHRDPNYSNTYHWNYIPNIGYRRITKRKIMYRFSLALVSNHNDDLPFAGFSIGKNF